ncbi:hypothetical protein BOTBODRAFT_249980 [Botryobasidium botryosum FD-172 SS1]|uniref:Uncharacterized protein n=1 Tax=Botryobasidium botryosum (strain FD-172 SS1) TaxID=930990 RepID=A0A067MP30_BOTB1|nr:hypothetical protein BOTBODRAFT_249980 [Botryobasidium botryosum FD-172 SS1]
MMRSRVTSSLVASLECAIGRLGMGIRGQEGKCRRTLVTRGVLSRRGEAASSVQRRVYLISTSLGHPNWRPNPR